MRDILADICEAKHAHIQEHKAQISLQTLEKKAKEAPPTRGFAQALRTRVQQNSIGLIAEIKKASPSQGVLRASFDPTAIASAYAAAGATCLSVLTDTPYFQGQDHDLVQARAAASLPILRKDFMLDPYQIIESRALGADCILLIMAALCDAKAKELEDVALDLGMDVLVEVHDQAEMERALQLRTRLIGINNRNLKTLAIDLATTEALAPMVPEAYLCVCESGVHASADIARIQQANVHCFLVGHSLMQQEDPGKAVASLLAH